MHKKYLDGVLPNFIGSLVGGILGVLFSSQNIVFIALFSAIGTLTANSFVIALNGFSIRTVFRVENLTMVSMLAVLFLYSYHFYIVQFLPNITQMNYMEIAMAWILSIGVGYLLGGMATGWIFFYLETAIYGYKKINSFHYILYLISVPSVCFIVANCFTLNTDDAFFRASMCGIPTMAFAAVLPEILEFGK